MRITTISTILVLAISTTLFSQNVENETLTDIKNIFSTTSDALKYEKYKLAEEKFKLANKKIKSLRNNSQESIFYLEFADQLSDCCIESVEGREFIYSLLYKTQRTDKKDFLNEQIKDKLVLLNTNTESSKNIERNIDLAKKLTKDEAFYSYLREQSKPQILLRSLKKENAEIERSTLELAEVKDSLSSELVEVTKKQEILSSEYKRQLDSLHLIAAMDSIKRLQIESQLEKEQAKSELQASEKRLFRIGLFSVGCALLLLSLLYFNLLKFNRRIKKQKLALIAQKEKNEELLLNILPASIAEELLVNGTVEPQFYNSGTIFFADFVNFSSITKSITKERLIQDLDDLFRIFDGLTEKYDIEKIKTIGDAYMCINGVPNREKHDPAKVIDFSLEIIQALEEWNKERNSVFLPKYHTRIGIHTGPITAGVVGSKKFTYDIWGKSVNIAARVESNGSKDRINISEDTYQLVKDQYLCEPRGSIVIKNLGEMKMYFVHEKIKA